MKVLIYLYREYRHFLFKFKDSDLIIILIVITMCSILQTSNTYCNVIIFNY